MPSGDIHKLFQKLFLSNFTPLVDQMIDGPATQPIWHLDAEGKWVFSPLGPQHRQMFHDPLTAMLMGAVATPTNPAEGAMAGLLHIATDTVFDKMHDIANLKVKHNRKRKR